MEHYRRRLLDQPEQRTEVRFIAEALRAWSWAFHLARPRDILRGLARAATIPHRQALSQDLGQVSIGLGLFWISVF